MKTLNINEQYQIRIDNNGNHTVYILTSIPEKVTKDGEVVPAHDEFVHNGTFHGSVSQALMKLVNLIENDENYDILEYLDKIKTKYEEFERNITKIA